MEEYSSSPEEIESLRRVFNYKLVSPDESQQPLPGRGRTKSKIIAPLEKRSATEMIRFGGYSLPNTLRRDIYEWGSVQIIKRDCEAIVSPEKNKSLRRCNILLLLMIQQALPEACFSGAGDNIL